MHALSGRSGEFILCSMAGVPANLENSHLAGHRRGAFTGAHTDRAGPIELAHRGTLFLDELALATPRVQEILLQLLDDGTLSRVGEVRARPVDVRLIAATNADLPAMREAGVFRADLLGRFGYLTLQIPPLAARRELIIPLVEFYLAECSRELGRTPVPVCSADLRDCLVRAPWHDNIRQVQALCRYLVLNWETDFMLHVADLPLAFLSESQIDPADFDLPYVERIHEVLRRTGGNKTRAARLLGISRSTLYRLLVG